MKLIKQTRPIDKHAPRNKFEITVRVMHGDADHYENNSYMYCEQDEYKVLEIIELIKAAWNMGYDAINPSEVQKVLEAYKKEHDVSFEYPSDVYSDLVGYDVTSGDGQFYATPEEITVAWYDDRGEEFPVKIKKDGVEHETLYKYS